MNIKFEFGMVDIKDKKNCCGCSACFNACPTNAIKMSEDEEGFLYPKVDFDKCVNCRLCEKVCPVLAIFEHKKYDYNSIKSPVVCYAAKNKNVDMLYLSSSGGVFPAIAEMFIKNGGVVFGAKYDTNFDVYHTYAETLEDVSLFYTSKYVQSDIKSTYQDVESFLKAGRPVLFSGTPCQIVGLRRFLRKNYDYLFCIEVFCHGVPSPKAWRVFLDFFEKKALGLAKLINVNFRNKKRCGWKNYNTLFYVDAVPAEEQILTLDHERNLYMKAFLGDFSLRPSCFYCPAKFRNSKADISIGDFWGYNGILNKDNLGVSAVILKTAKGADLFDKVKNAFFLEKTTYSRIVKQNSAIEKSKAENPRRKEFFAALNSDTPIKNIKKVLKLPLKVRIRRFFSRCYHKIFFKAI